MRRFLSVTCLYLAFGCGAPSAPPAASPAPPAPSSPPAPAVAAPSPAPAVAAPSYETYECADWCTELAVCWEAQHPDQDYRNGGACVTKCEELAPAEQRAWANDIQAALERDDCAALDGYD